MLWKQSAAAWLFVALCVMQAGDYVVRFTLSGFSTRELNASVRPPSRSSTKR